MITACFARAFQQYTGRLYMGFLSIFQAVRPTDKTYNQLALCLVFPCFRRAMARYGNIYIVLKLVIPRQEGARMADHPFVTDIQTLRARARQHIEQGAVTQGYRADRDTVIRLLQEALATELVCVLRYKRHYFMATGINAQSVAQEFLQHATEEQVHADQIAQRIVQLGGAPNFSPDGLLTRSHSEYIEGESLRDMIAEDLVAERIAIDSYREMIQYFGNDDPTTRRLMETILAVEEEHAEDLVTLLEKIGA
jgi:bacterioferritin